MITTSAIVVTSTIIIVIILILGIIIIIIIIIIINTIITIIIISMFLLPQALQLLYEVPLRSLQARFSIIEKGRGRMCIALCWAPACQSLAGARQSSVRRN